MFKLATEQALLDAFRPKDRTLVELPPGQVFPAFVRNYLAWTHPAGGRVYLVFSVPGGVPTGIVFDSSGGSPSGPALCDWCHCVAAGAQVGLLTARVHARKTAGVHVCVDLGCQEKLEDQANLMGRSAVPLVEDLLKRMGRFASEALKIDLSGAGR